MTEFMCGGAWPSKRGDLPDTIPERILAREERELNAEEAFAEWQANLKLRAHIDERVCDECHRGYTTRIEGWRIWYCECYDAERDNAIYVK